MTLQQFLAHVNAGNRVVAESEMHLFMIELAIEAQRITTELNGTFKTAGEIRELMSQFTGKPVTETFGMFPPFTSDCGKNTTFGENVFINAGCRFQDQGGITISDNCRISHNVVIATLNHGLEPIRFLHG